MTVFYFLLSVSLSFLTGCIALLFYLKTPAEWLCEAGETPREEHAPLHRCPRREPAILLMTAVTELSFCISGQVLWFPAPEPRELLFLIAAAIILFPAALSDADYFIIPDQTCLAALLLALLKSVSSAGLSGLAAAAGGGVLCGAMSLLASWLGRLVSGADSLGMGDVKLLSACGALASSAAPSGLWMTASCSVYIGSVLSSAVWFSALLLCRRARYGDVRPLGPWIVLSTLLVLALW